jgi:hypothetical protein
MANGLFKKKKKDTQQVALENLNDLSASLFGISNAVPLWQRPIAPNAVDDVKSAIRILGEALVGAGYAGDFKIVFKDMSDDVSNRAFDLSLGEEGDYQSVQMYVASGLVRLYREKKDQRTYYKKECGCVCFEEQGLFDIPDRAGYYAVCPHGTHEVAYLTLHAQAKNPDHYNEKLLQ